MAATKHKAPRCKLCGRQLRNMTALFKHQKAEHERGPHARHAVALKANALNTLEGAIVTLTAKRDRIDGAIKVLRELGTLLDAA